MNKNIMSVFLLTGATALSATPAFGQVPPITFDTNTITQGNACVGDDCLVLAGDHEDEALKLKGQVLRLKFEDTSTTGGMPGNDWQITINENTSGGEDMFSIEDLTNGSVPFTIEGSTADNSLYINAAGLVGLGTESPEKDVHIVSLDTPAIRLEQEASLAGAAQIWDIVGNDASFLIRDVTSSLVPFQIDPGAPGSSLVVAESGGVGLGTDVPDSALHIKGGNSEPQYILVQGNATQYVSLDDTSPGGMEWNYASISGEARIVNPVNPGIEFRMDATGNVTILGTLTQGSDVNNKTAIVPVDSSDILQKVAALPVSSWSYKGDAADGVRHIGPTAQDFYAAFGTGASETGISAIDTGGVALAAIQALTTENAALKARLSAENAMLTARLEALERKMSGQ